ncbi:hypothetical protein GOA58_03300 [Sinorhizobium meliloti]|nr:hypothetical protein [Sinorhizobium meliloti]MDW9659172.1 hypothetical protein [Sinorhizobium meliloti]MDX0050306.1 hypothetical protein [Sinorhizobium meliloti]
MGLTHSFFLIPVPVTGSAASAARENPFGPRIWAGWIPVTSTGMRNGRRASPNRSERTSFHVEVETERREQGLRRDPGAPPRRP